MIELLNGLYEEDSGGGTPREKKKYNASVSAFLGDTASDGCLRIASERTDLVFNGVTYIASQALMYKFLNSNVTSVDFPDLERLHTPSCCESAWKESSIATINWNKLKEISGSNALYEAFYYSQLTNVVIPAEEISGRKCLAGAFGNCRQLISLTFPALNNVGSETTQFDSMLQGVTGCTVRFPADMERIIGSWESVQNGFGGTNTVVLFDL